MSENNAFIGFTYNGKHSIDDLHIYRVSDGSRYNDNIIPTLTDKTAEIPNADGMFFFNSYHKEKTFSVNIAFDDLSEGGLRLLRQTFNGKGVHELIFDEEPNKVWNAKVTGTPNLKYICFDKKTLTASERVYKGEGTLQFTCYWPYAHSKQPIPREDETSSPSEDIYYTNGDILAPFKLYDRLGIYEPIQTDIIYTVQISSDKVEWKTLTTLTISNYAFELLNNEPYHLFEIQWDSRSGLVTIDSIPVRYIGNSLCVLPNQSYVKISSQFTEKPSYDLDSVPCEIYNWYY